MTCQVTLMRQNEDHRKASPGCETTMLHEKSVILHRCIHYVYTCVYYMLMIVNVYCTEVLSTHTHTSARLLMQMRRLRRLWIVLWRRCAQHHWSGARCGSNVAASFGVAADGVQARGPKIVKHNGKALHEGSRDLLPWHHGFFSVGTI